MEDPGFRLVKTCAQVDALADVIVAAPSLGEIQLHQSDSPRESIGSPGSRVAFAADACTTFDVPSNAIRLIK